MLVLAILLQSAQPVAVEKLPQVPLHHGGRRQVTCPVGGERFAAPGSPSFPTLGSRPDGRSYGIMPDPFPLPECPGNSLVVFDDFSPREVALLTDLIARSDYRAMLDTQTSYYRAWWLASALGRPPADTLALLLRAAWQVTPDGGSRAIADVRTRQYQELFIAEVARLAPAAPERDRLWMLSRAANAARQLGRFDQAEALRRDAARAVEAASRKDGWDRFLARLDAVIARRDAGVEPLDMIPDREAARACVERIAPSAFDRAFCARPEVAAEAELLRRLFSPRARPPVKSTPPN